MSGDSSDYKNKIISKATPILHGKIPLGSNLDIAVQRANHEKRM
jgi:hypothetical protein